MGGGKDEVLGWKDDFRANRIGEGWVGGSGQVFGTICIKIASL